MLGSLHQVPQATAPRTCAGATGARARREASPGKLGAFEDELFRNAEMADVPVVAAVALAYVDGARTVRGTGSAGPGARCGCMPAGCGRDPAPMLQAPCRAHCMQAAAWLDRPQALLIHHGRAPRTAWTAGLAMRCAARPLTCMLPFFAQARAGVRTSTVTSSTGPTGGAWSCLLDSRRRLQGRWAFKVGYIGYRTDLARRWVSRSWTPQRGGRARASSRMMNTSARWRPCCCSWAQRRSCCPRRAWATALEAHAWHMLARAADPQSRFACMTAEPAACRGTVPADNPAS